MVRLQAELDEARAAQATLESSAAAREAQLLADRAVLERERHSEREATEQVTARLTALETRLESERAQGRVVRRRFIFGVVVVATLSLIAVTIWGPDHLHWMHRALKLHHRKAVQATTVTVWAALAVAVVKPIWRVYALSGVVIGAGFTLIQLIGS